ncbi:hypothetical protein NC652_025200 [Populus alba x Populus x berolinensis]|nr:hypothetical protein NC652_025200 [Populus alba x Populus x berolinensis]
MPVACLVFYANSTLSFDGPVHLSSARKEKRLQLFGIVSVTSLPHQKHFLLIRKQR